MDYLNFELVSPDRTLFKDRAWEVLLPTASGQIGVLPGHIPLISRIVPGEIVIKKASDDKNPQFCFTSGGFVEVTGNSVRVLADAAENVRDIDEARAEEAKKRAERIMQESKDNVEFSEASAALERAIGRLKVARKHKRSHHNLGT